MEDINFEEFKSSTQVYMSIKYCRNSKEHLEIAAIFSYQLLEPFVDAYDRTQCKTTYDYFHKLTKY